jgi:hypothetical protein
MPNHLHEHAKEILRAEPSASRNEVVSKLRTCVQCVAAQKSTPLTRIGVKALRKQLKAKVRAEEKAFVSGLSTESMTLTEYMESPPFERWATGN